MIWDFYGYRPFRSHYLYWLSLFGVSWKEHRTGLWWGHKEVLENHLETYWGDTSCPGFFSKSRKLVSSMVGITRWKKCFEKLLNPADRASKQVTKVEDLEDFQSISMVQDAGVDSKLSCGKATDLSKIPPELLKALDTFKLSWLTACMH